MDAIRMQLVSDHRMLDDLFCRLLRDVHVLSHHDLKVVWCELEHRLLAHMDVEEQFLLPLVAATHEAAIERALADHVRIRGLVAALGVAIELNAAREPAIEELMQILHIHSEHEDRMLYRFACERASVAVQHRMAMTLRAAGRFAHDSAAKTLANRASPAPAASPGVHVERRKVV
jgi:hypothetical protein